MELRLKTGIEVLPDRWVRLGKIMEPGAPGSFDSSVTGDPCIVRDQRHSYRMFYFAQRHEDGGEANCNAHAVCSSFPESVVGTWRKLGPIEYVNPSSLVGDTHKPWILMDPYEPNTPVRIGGEYWLFTVTYRGVQKIVQVATSASLGGPWKVRPTPVLVPGDAADFDGYHTDSVTAYWFADRGEILLFYKGYPKEPQLSQPHSPYGSCTAVATMKPSDARAHKVDTVLMPSTDQSHWTSGWVGPLQILPALKGGWYGLLSASPTPPASIEEEPTMREPAPSLGGWAYTAAEWPVEGWKAFEQPIEWIDDIPEEYQREGEGVNLWRHHVVLDPEGRMYLFYNTGPYGRERMFGRRSVEKAIFVGHQEHDNAI